MFVGGEDAQEGGSAAAASTRRPMEAGAGATTRTEVQGE